MRRILNQTANAAVKAQGSVFQAHYRRMVGRDPKTHAKAIRAVANRLRRLIWIILHCGGSYEERGQAPNPRAARRRAQRLLGQLARLGYNAKLEPMAATA